MILADAAGVVAAVAAHDDIVASVGDGVGVDVAAVVAVAVVVVVVWFSSLCVLGYQGALHHVIKLGTAPDRVSSKASPKVVSMIWKTTVRQGNRNLLFGSSIKAFPLPRRIACFF